MQITRRGFTRGAVGLALAGRLGGIALAQSRPEIDAALAAIRTYGEAHRTFMNLPGMTLGVSMPDGFSAVMHFGFANADSRAPISPDTLFQIGSISKVMTATVLHQYAAEGRFGLGDRISSLMPSFPLPEGNAITVQHLLDHVAGLPGDEPLFVPGGQRTAYAPGTHWHYSNTGYDMLGKLAEHVGGKPLDQLLAEHVFGPLDMRRSKGSIVGADRGLYAQGYEAADPTIPFARGVPWVPASWVDVTFGAGSVASTADDMIRFFRSLSNAAQGRGGLGLPPEQGKIFTSHFVPSDTADMSYGNGLMHVTNAGRSYFHHTGGMVAFSSSFHVDKASEVAAFASASISGFAEYRPRLLTRYAVDALTSALARESIPTPPQIDTPLPSPAAYAGHYSGPSGGFEVLKGNPLTIVAGGQSAPLQYWGGHLFRTTHPAFRNYTLMFERPGNAAVKGASWGPLSFVRDGSAGKIPASDAALAKLSGRYVNDSPWVGTAMVVERGGKLWMGTDTPMTPISDNLWRVGEESWNPERGSFADFIDGRPQTFIFSGEKFLRHDI